MDRLQFRHEWKIELSPTDMLILRQRLGAVLARDEHAVNGTYHIRSLYFDTPEDTALREKLDGVSRREKFRIRLYNGDESLIRLEKKCRQGSLGSKDQAPLTAEEARRIIAGDLVWMASADRPLVRELYDKMTLRGLRPKTIVDYTREPFVFAPGNVRVTLDYDIRTGLCATGLLDPGCVTVPIPDAPALLEVKWDDFLPTLIRDLVQLDSRRSSAFSKYAACRAYD